MTFVYPSYARAERIADGAMHALGLTFAVAGAVWLIVWAAYNMNGGQIAALSIYGGCLIATYLASTIYHFTPWERLRPAFRRLDHAAIYFKIAGTYTPFVILLNSLFAYALLALVWTLALGGAATKLFFWRHGGSGVLLYLGMGWMGLALIWVAVPVLPTVALWLMLAGGLLYSAGTIFFVLERLKFSLAIWHGFVLAATICFFAAISTGAAASLG